jgi:large subunit ribosomal protein L25
MTEIDIACLPKDLPEFIEVDLSQLDTAHSLHVSGVTLPAGVTVVTHRTGDPVVATAVVPKAVVETEEVAAEGEEAAAAVAAPAAEGAKPAEAKPEEKGGKKDAGGDDKKKK